jgi:hypothetical protein
MEGEGANLAPPPPTLPRFRRLTPPGKSRPASVAAGPISPPAVSGWCGTAMQRGGAWLGRAAGRWRLRLEERVTAQRRGSGGACLLVELLVVCDAEAKPQTTINSPPLLSVCCSSFYLFDLMVLMNLISTTAGYFKQIYVNVFVLSSSSTYAGGLHFVILFKYALCQDLQYTYLCFLIRTYHILFER